MTDSPAPPAGAPAYLSLADLPEAALRDHLIRIVRACPPLMAAFRQARALALPDWWIVSGALYNQVWNHLTGKPDFYGVKDIDLFYFDPDLSYAAEDGAIRNAAKAFTGPVPVEVRNQARVHLWYRDHFGTADYPQLMKASDGIDNFACITHAVGMRLRPDDGFEIHAPFGLRDIFAMRLVPHTIRDNRATHKAKAARQIALWPELEVVPWPD